VTEVTQLQAAND